MSNSESTHPDPSVVPQNPTEAKSPEPVQPGQSPALSKVPNGVKTTISKADEILLRISKYVIFSRENA